MDKQTIGRILSYVKRYRGRMAIACICAVVYAVSNVLSLYTLRPILNDLIAGTATPESLAKGVTILGTIYLLGVIGRFVQQRITIKISQQTVMNMREELFEKLQSMPLSYFDTTAHGDTMSLFANDLDAVGIMLNNAAIGLLIAVAQIIATLVLMIMMNIPLTILTLILSLIIMLLAMRLVKASGSKYATQQEMLGEINAYSEEMVAGQKIVQLFSREELTKQEFGNVNQKTCETQEQAQFSGSVLEPVLTNLCRCVYGIIALVGGLMCLTMGFDVGGLTVFSNYAGNFCSPIAEVASQVSIIFSAIAGASRVFAVMDADSEIPDAADAVSIVQEQDTYTYGEPYNREVEGHVVLSDVTFGYVPSVPILKNISVEAKPGTKIAIVGSTGAGKTTIINLVNRFYEIDSGTITIDDIDVRSMKRDDLRRSVAIVLQDTHLFTGTVRENIRYGRLDATDEEVEAAAKLASAHQFIMRLEDGYDTVLENDAANLSQGQRQLLSIARAAVSNAPILILDEATSSVDTRTERFIQEGMDRLMERRTAFVIAHRLSTVRNASNIIYLDDGRIVESGSHDELLEAKGRYYQLYTGKAEL